MPNESVGAAEQAMLDELEKKYDKGPEASSTKSRSSSSQPTTRPKATAETQSGLVLTFGLPDNSEQVVAFGQRKPPMGMDFTKSNESTVAIISRIRPGSHAEELGIQIGWEIIKVNGQSAVGKSHEEVLFMMKAACSV